jgi:hypothetical protein
MRTLRLAATAFAACALSACAVGASMAATFQATMDGASEVPPKVTQGKGAVTATLDPATKVLTYHVTFSGLTGPATAGHFHGPAAVGVNAGVVLPFKPPIVSPIDGTATLTDAQIADLTAGKWYANVHTAANPGGEIRGQMMPK